MSLGQYLRKLRDERDLSLREFAKKAKCSAAFVSDVELGRRYPSDELLATMAAVLETTVDELRKHDIRPPTEEMRRLIAYDPRYALAFRTVMDKAVSPEALIKLAGKQRGSVRKKK
jgi:transcriptional regulator with XRE-family HTH domain